MAASRATMLRNCNPSAAVFHQHLSLLWRSPNPQSAAVSAAKPVSIFNQQLMMSYEDRPSDSPSKPSFDPSFSLSAFSADRCGGDFLRMALARAPKKVIEEEEVVYREAYEDDVEVRGTDDDSDEDYSETDEDFSDHDSDDED